MKPETITQICQSGESTLETTPMNLTRRQLLRTAIAAPLLPLAAAGGKTTILILCTGNSARSLENRGTPDILWLFPRSSETRLWQHFPIQK